MVTIGLGIAGVTLLLTVIATPVVFVVEGVATGTGGLNVVSNLVCEKLLSSKARKRMRIMMLTEAKINTISDHISKALKDNHVSYEEFSLIQSELSRFNQMKDEIKTKAKSKIYDETKQSLIKQCKEQAVEKFKNMIGKTQWKTHFPFRFIYSRYNHVISHDNRSSKTGFASTKVDEDTQEYHA